MVQTRIKNANDVKKILVKTYFNNRRLGRLIDMRGSNIRWEKGML